MLFRSMNLGLLGYFKYTDFFIENISRIPGLNDMNIMGIVLPIGISFYTFQKMSYVIDVYRGKCVEQRSFIRFAMYVTLFPQLIAGPIVRYDEIEESLGERKVTAQQFYQGIVWFIVGLAKKVLLANSIGALWETYQGLGIEKLSVVGTWLAILAYTFQIYFDFSGYSDMAIGLGKMFGFHFPRNFNYPYIATSITDFWRRWHISLTSWFREYLYIPMGGNRVGKIAWLRNIFIVWFATGMWHGASWNFIMWGLYYAIILVIEKMFLQKWLDRLPRFLSPLRHVYVLFFVMIGWAIFASDTLPECLAIIKGALGGASGGLVLSYDWYYLKSYIPLVVIAAISSTPWAKKRVEALPYYTRAIFIVLALIVGCVLTTASIVDSTYNPFLYFRF